MLPGRSYRGPAPVIIPDMRTHADVWKQYNLRTGKWPVTSMLLFASRFVFILLASATSGFLLRQSFFASTKHLIAGLLALALGMYCYQVFSAREEALSQQETGG